MDAGTWAVLLLLCALGLLAAELFIPSGGLIGLAAGICLLASLYNAWHAWWASSPMYFWAFVGSAAVLVPVAVGIALAVWPHTTLGRRAILVEPSPEEVTPFSSQEARFAALVGQVGETVTLLNPAGIARFGEERVHCQSEGLILEAGVPVRVIAARNNRVIVRRYDPSTAPAEGSRPASARGDDGLGPLDFDLG